MLKLLGGLITFLGKVNEDVIIDGVTFRFHTVLTAALLFACSLIVTATQYVGTPISCMVRGVPAPPVNTYCWITSTFTIPEIYHNTKGLSAAHPGVGPDRAEDRKYHSYYQWVCFVLFLQGLACYVPKWLWNNWEGGLMRTLVAGMNHHQSIVEDVQTKRERLLIYLIDHIKRHRWYAFKYWICEAMCLLNLVAQMWAMNVFFSGEFYNYGLKVINLFDGNQYDRVDPMVYIFPRVTKCIFHKYGPSGTIQSHDALCILSLNIVNEKTYIIIWFWFAASSLLLIVLCCYRAAMLLLPSIRPRLLQINRSIVSKHEMRVVGRKLDIGDWWVLYMLRENLDSLVYNEIIIDLAKKFDDKASNDFTMTARR